LLLEIFIFLIVAALIFELLDSSLGMGYGTLLSPLLLFLGFPVLVVVPSILITQAFGGLTATYFHHKHGNADFRISKNKENELKKQKGFNLANFFKHELSVDLKTVCIVSLLGVFAVIFSTIVAIKIPKEILTLYISLLVITMGIIILANKHLKYSGKKMVLVGAVSAFNKGLSGGGYGPVVTGGQMVLGKEEKSAVACTTAAEPLICIVGFISYFLLNGLASWNLVFSLGIGAIIGGILGPIVTKKMDRKYFTIIVSVLMLVFGILSLLALFGAISLKISL